MRFNFKLLLLSFIIVVTTHAQNDKFPSLNIGDTAPPLRVRGWIKGAPVQRFEKGNVYVVEFWATWCKPCIAAMPHLSALASEYKDKITILGINIYERKNTSMEKVKAFVDSMGQLMGYHVAAEDSNFMVAGWLDASGEQVEGIPRSFVVDAEGRVAWIGHPKELNQVLPQIVNNTWNIKSALTKRNLDKHLKKRDEEVNYQLIAYTGDTFKQDYLGKPDSALLVINEIIKTEPKLKYAPLIASHTFSSLLKTNLHKAYEYGKVMMVTPTYVDPAYNVIIDDIKWYSDKLNLSPEIYKLGAEAYEVKIDQIPYPEIVNISKYYNKMAEWYWRAKDKPKAIEAQQKAIEVLKAKKGFSETEMDVFKSRLKQYNNR